MKNLYFKLKLGGGVNSCLSKNKSWFTLVELIIVVTILAILATIAFLTLWDYPMQARDSRRLTDKNNIEKALEIYKVKNWEYPNFLDKDEDGDIVFWDQVWNQVNTIISTLPRDPLTNKFYKLEIQPDKIAKVFFKWETKLWEITLNLWIYSPNWIYLWEKERNYCDRNSYWRFVVNDKIILDTRTDLEWSKDISKLITYREAIEYCKNLKTWGKEWRVPNIIELSSIRNMTCYEKSYLEFDTLWLGNNWSYTSGGVRKRLTTRFLNSVIEEQYIDGLGAVICVWKNKSSKLIWEDKTQNLEFVNWTNKWPSWIVRDKNTGLFWESQNEWGRVSLEKAKKYCSNLTKWWRKWRLPKITEWETLYDYKRNSAREIYYLINSINTDYFNIGNSLQWTSTRWTDRRDFDFFLFSPYEVQTYNTWGSYELYFLCVSDPE